MNQLEQFREQCAAAGDDIAIPFCNDIFVGGDAQFRLGVKFCREIFKQRIRALALPEVTQPIDNVKTLRDEFAMTALASYSYSHPCDTSSTSNMQREVLAKHCYAIADAMIKERSEGGAA